MKRAIGRFALVAALQLIIADGAACGNTGGSPAGGGGAPAGNISPVAAASAATTASPAHQGKYKIGEWMIASDGKRVVVQSFVPHYNSGNEFEQPAAGNECVLVGYTLTNGSDLEWDLPLYELQLVDANGQKYSESFSCGTSTNIEALVAGGHANASVVYEVPKGTPLDAVWVPDVFANEVYQTVLR